MEWKDYKQAIKESIDANDLGRAEQLLLEAMGVLKQSENADERLCVCLDQLGWIYIGQRKLELAQAHYLESLNIKSKVLGEKNPIVGKALKKLATVSYMAENYVDAERYGKRALNVLKSTAGAKNEETQQTMLDVVSLLNHLNRKVEARIIEQSINQSLANPEASDLGAQSIIKVNICPECKHPFEGRNCPRCNVVKV
ncbi:tetratricopeptide repeat protein [bacterium]|nr:tetratricopeptide repeat protein [bacterium]QQR57191.1 MAG: tetratricopeptide repeat protein [Candidatus Melainabacteria bacterium]